MIQTKITEEQRQRAKKLYNFKVLKGSITKGKGNIYGSLGEIVVYDLSKENGLDVDFNSTYDYDLILNGYKVDVKTKGTSVKPKDNYLCSIAAHNIKQKCDFYFFARVNYNLKDCYLLGHKRKNDFFDNAIFNEKGSFDVNGWDFKADCYNLKISQLNKYKLTSK